MGKSLVNFLALFGFLFISTASFSKIHKFELRNTESDFHIRLALTSSEEPEEGFCRFNVDYKTHRPEDGAYGEGSLFLTLSVDDSGAPLQAYLKAELSKRDEMGAFFLEDIFYPAALTFKDKVD